MKSILALAVIVFSTIFTIHSQQVTEFPYEASFEGVEGNLNENYPEFWTSEDLNTQPIGNQPWQIIKNSAFADNARTDSTAIHMFSHATETNNDWLFTPSIDMEAGMTYELTFWYKVAAFGGTAENLKVHTGSSPSATSMLESEALWTGENLTNDVYQSVTVVYEAVSDEVRNFGFHYFSESFQYILYVDDVSIQESLTIGVGPEIASSIDYDFKLIENKLEIEFKSDSKLNSNLQILNATGEILLEERIEPQTEKAFLDLSEFSSGIYFLILTKDKNSRRVIEKFHKP